MDKFFSSIQNKDKPAKQSDTGAQNDERPAASDGAEKKLPKGVVLGKDGKPYVNAVLMFLFAIFGFSMSCKFFASSLCLNQPHLDTFSHEVDADPACPSETGWPWPSAKAVILDLQHHQPHHLPQPLLLHPYYQPPRPSPLSPPIHLIAHPTLTPSVTTHGRFYTLYQRHTPSGLRPTSNPT
jgi:hypothetical protein